jgi:hypothetical protein
MTPATMKRRRSLSSVPPSPRMMSLNTTSISSGLMRPRPEVIRMSTPTSAILRR